MRFSRAYATCQVCSPTRASIMTGKYTPGHGITDYLGSKSGEEWRELGRHDKMLPAYDEDGLRPDEIIFPMVMRDAGYRTFFAGKWHFGEENAYPEDFGFEINKGGWRVGGPVGGYFSPWENPNLESGPDGECLPLRLARETAEFIDRGVEPGRPGVDANSSGFAAGSKQVVFSLHDSKTRSGIHRPARACHVDRHRRRPDDSPDRRERRVGAHVFGYLCAPRAFGDTR